MCPRGAHNKGTQLHCRTADRMQTVTHINNRGAEYNGRVGHNDYQLYLAINDIDHTKIAISPTNK